ncbi:Nephrin, partial [Pseudolycoriella hygida]
APVCSTIHDELFGALKHETLSLKCEVDASPPADSFHWTFNSSGEPTELPSRLHTSETGYSRLNYTPTTDLDYGTISCRARNAIGLQKMPCTFQVVAAVKPFGLQNCSITNQSPDSLQVECTEGFDGGLPQVFIMELINLSDMRLVRNLSVMHPPVLFFIDNLEPEFSYKIILFSVNAKGKSEPTIIDDVTFKGVSKFTGYSNGFQVSISPILACLTLFVAVIFAVACVVSATVYRRHYSKNAEANLKSTKQHTELIIKTSDCQLDPPLQARSLSGISKSIEAGDIHRRDPKFADPFDDDTDPDVIPNQY